MLASALPLKTWCKDLPRSESTRSLSSATSVPWHDPIRLRLRKGTKLCKDSLLGHTMPHPQSFWDKGKVSTSTSTALSWSALPRSFRVAHRSATVGPGLERFREGNNDRRALLASASVAWEDEFLKSYVVFQTKCAFDQVSRLDSRNMLGELPMQKMQARATTLVRQQNTIVEVVQGIWTRVSRVLGGVSRHRIGALLQGFATLPPRAGLPWSCSGNSPFFTRVAFCVAKVFFIDQDDQHCRIGFPDEANCTKHLGVSCSTSNFPGLRPRTACDGARFFVTSFLRPKTYFRKLPTCHTPTSIVGLDCDGRCVFTDGGSRKYHEGDSTWWRHALQSPIRVFVVFSESFAGEVVLLFECAAVLTNNTTEVSGSIESLRFVLRRSVKIVGVWPARVFFRFWHLSCLLCETVIARCLLLSTLCWCLFGSRPTSQFAPHGNLVVCIVTKKEFIVTILVVIIFVTCCQRRSKNTERIITVFWLLV